MRTCFYESHRRCVVFVCGERALDEHEWDTYLAFLTATFKPDLPNRSLVIVKKGSLTSVQRTKLARVIAPFDKTMKSAVLTESAIVRGMVTALQWFSRDVFRIFSLDDIEPALDFLELQGNDREIVRELSLSLQEKLAASEVTAA